MTGSWLVPVVVPIVAVIALAVWLTMVYYADSHPMHGNSDLAPAPPGVLPERQEAGAAAPDASGAASPQQEAVPPPPQRSGDERKVPAGHRG